MRAHRRTLGTLGVALLVVVGLQSFRVLTPSIAWYLRDTKLVPSTGLIPYALGPFLLALALPAIARAAGSRRVFVAAAATLAAARAAEQLVRDPAVDLWVSMAAVVAFLWLLPLTALRDARSFGIGLTLGLAIDTAVRGLGNTLDLSWMTSPWASVLAVALALATGAVLLASREHGEPAKASPAWLGIGAILFAQMLVLQNTGWVSAVSGATEDQALLVVAVGNVCAVLAAASMPAVTRYARAAPVVGGLLLAIALLAATAGSSAAWLLVIGGLAGGGALIEALFATEGEPRLARAATWMGLGMLSFVVLALIYYLTLDVALPLSQDATRLTAAGIVVATSIALLRRAAKHPARPVGTLAPLIAAALVLVPVLAMAGEDEPAQAPPTGLVRVMTYNVHSAYDTAGVQDPEGIARAIEAAAPDVVGLQEVSRGWLIDGSTDLLTWLSDRLGMPYTAFLGTADPVWGNAIVSRYPILTASTGFLPAEGTLLRRGYLSVVVDPLGAQPIRVIDTHLHHLADDLTRVHLLQVAALLDGWGESGRTVLVGDFNAEPGTPEIAAILRAGFADAWARGRGAGLTANAAKPDVRIDYVFHTPDLRALEARVIESTASDHFGVVATLNVA
ncbi:MAG TPA: endonuclease/exonuclease/phosphatase family protein [Actinomycetota bacterium]